MKFRFGSVVPKYLNFATFAGDLLCTLTLLQARNKPPENKHGAGILLRTKYEVTQSFDYMLIG
jgi:hypothetical protein